MRVVHSFFDSEGASGEVLFTKFSEELVVHVGCGQLEVVEVLFVRFELDVECEGVFEERKQRGQNLATVHVS